MKNATPLLAFAPVLTGLILLIAAAIAHPQSSKNDELSEIVPAVDDLLPEPSEPNALPKEAVAAFLASDNVTLYSVSEAEGTHGPIQDYTVLGKARINRRETAALIENLKNSLAKENGVAMCGLCFTAHHVLRTETGGHIYDFMICYPCRQVLTYGSDSKSARHFISANWMEGSPDLIKRIAKSHGLPQPQVFIDEELDAQNEAKAYAQWLNSIPQSLRPFFPQIRDPSNNSVSPSLDALRIALAKQIPDTKPRILALFSWYGSVPWGAFDNSAEHLLKDYPFADLWSQAQSARLTDAQLQGAARFFATQYVASREEDSPGALQEGIRKYSEERDHWLQIMPASIRPLWSDEMWRYRDYYGDAVTEGLVRANEQLMLDALTREFHDRNERILVLFNWYGIDTEENTFGRYQAVIGDLLQQFTTAELAQALQSTTLTGQQLNGATRLISESEFSKVRRVEIRNFSPSLKAVLWAHSKKSGNGQLFNVLFAPSRPTPGDGVIHPFVRQVEPNDDYVAFVTIAQTQLEPQFAALLFPDTPMDERFGPPTATGDGRAPCINTGKARYLINTHQVLLFEILADCANLIRGYGYVICPLGAGMRCAEPPDWYFTGRQYQLTNEGLQVDGAAPNPWNDPIETQRRLQAMAASINESRNRSLLHHASPERWLYCRRPDLPNSTNLFACSAGHTSEMCKDYPNLDGIRDGEAINMNSPVGLWIAQRSKNSDTDTSIWACWVETH